MAGAEALEPTWRRLIECKGIHPGSLMCQDAGLPSSMVPIGVNTARLTSCQSRGL